MRGAALSYAAGRDGLQAVCNAEALLLSVTPRALPAIDRYVVALAPELRARYPPADDASGAPRVPWLPAFHEAFAGLMEEASLARAGRELTALETCCVVRARAHDGWEGVTRGARLR